MTVISFRHTKIAKPTGTKSNAITVAKTFLSIDVFVVQRTSKLTANGTSGSPKRYSDPT